MRTEEEQGRRTTRLLAIAAFGGLVLVLLSVSVLLLILSLSDGDEENDDADPDPQTLEGYFLRVEEVLQESDERFEEIGEDLSEEELQGPEAAVAVNDEARSIIEDALDQLRGLDPPLDVDGEHQALVSSAEEYLEELDRFIDALGDADSAGEVTELYEELPGSPLDLAAARLDTACQELQESADQADVSVDLTCGD